MGKQRKSRRRLTLPEEIEETEKLPQYDTVGVSISILRSLYLHGLIAMRDGDYASFSGYVSDLIRRDKHIRNCKPDHLIAIPTDVRTPEPGPEKPKLGFEKQGQPVLGKLLSLFFWASAPAWASWMTFVHVSMKHWH
jgi:hypothetical protein